MRARLNSLMHYQPLHHEYGSVHVPAELRLNHCSPNLLHIEWNCSISELDQLTAPYQEEMKYRIQDRWHTCDKLHNSQDMRCSLLNFVVHIHTRHHCRYT